MSVAETFIDETVDANGESTSWVKLEDGTFSLSISGTFTGTVALQRTRNTSDQSPVTIDYYTSAIEATDITNGGWYYRGLVTAWTSGEARIQLGQ